ncbi:MULTISPECIES: DNA polymerase IV [unclassified Thermoactinomyces]|jgi:nucleotidyltransferase/DNA polymerase involved in DNA repair|uniref:DNA polymerase IV n=1 Tax=unclassified Thermoactinomyces TaxID=2634588 RepID=UPI0018DD9014|nr:MULTISPECIES: DNA polymerase IV [unclassified Thermoactinomyces]MBH8597077.1 DNA polymerase IV [Thermoactinomyces sp. CICC 10523]MBH8602637.1 DNA polymerase IV [Thermoactinomyces sp. CICC 10522]
MESVVFLVDIQSFYASIEKALRPELEGKPVVVAGDPERRGGVILAACPLAKSYGIQNAITLSEATRLCPHLTVVRPRMGLYLKASLSITEILERFSDLVEPYSIDEQFVSISGSEKLFGDPLTIARKIQAAIRTELGVYARVGIGPNKVLSKMACDQFAKKRKTGIFSLTHDNLQRDLWPLPVEKLFGVGKRMGRHLRSIGIRTIGELARFPLERLKRKWGVNGHVLWMTANGFDLSPVTPQTFHSQKAIGHHMTLPRDYRTAEEIQVVLLELCEEVCRRARRHHLLGQTVSVGCRGADFDFPTGFYRQMKMPEATNQTMDLFHHAWNLFLRFWDGQPIRSLGVSLGGFASDDAIQLHLFDDREKKWKLGYVMDEIRQRFGPTSIVRAISLTPSGQAYERAQKIGGHYR